MRELNSQEMQVVAGAGLWKDLGNMVWGALETAGGEIEKLAGNAIGSKKWSDAGTADMNKGASDIANGAKNLPSDIINGIDDIAHHLFPGSNKSPSTGGNINF